MKPLSLPLAALLFILPVALFAEVDLIDESSENVPGLEFNITRIMNRFKKRIQYALGDLKPVKIVPIDGSSDELTGWVEYYSLEPTHELPRAASEARPSFHRTDRTLDRSMTRHKWLQQGFPVAIGIVGMTAMNAA
jgi:hypothetical protein